MKGVFGKRKSLAEENAVSRCFFALLIFSVTSLFIYFRYGDDSFEIPDLIDTIFGGSRTKKSLKEVYKLS